MQQPYYDCVSEHSQNSKGVILLANIGLFRCWIPLTANLWHISIVRSSNLLNYFGLNYDFSVRTTLNLSKKYFDQSEVDVNPRD